jgi:regulator of sirC expression with transglutaminase-like and TPR domain
MFVTRLIILILFCSFHTVAVAQSNGNDLASLQKILELPEDKIDLLEVKLLIDHMIDPKVDVAATRKALGNMVEGIKTILPPNASNQNKLIGLRRYIYLAGEWNNFKPFSYDFDDPYGHNIRNKLISTYLTTKKGNCISMPILLLLLGQKLGIDLSLSTAPLHVFIKFQDGAGKIINLEATDQAGPMSDAAYQKQTGMSDLAIKNGIYMQTLNKKETASVMIDTLFEYYFEKKQPEKMIVMTDLSMKYYPKNIAAIVYKGTAYALMVIEDYEQKYAMPSLIPFELRPRFVELSGHRDYWYDKAEVLGFAEADQSTEEQYKLRIQQQKAK